MVRSLEPIKSTGMKLTTLWSELSSLDASRKQKAIDELSRAKYNNSHVPEKNAIWSQVSKEMG